MDKHTFKVGDRVFGQVCTGDKKVPGVFVKIGGTRNDGCVIRRDDGVSGIKPGLYWFAKHLTTHDTDFEVGDWVRYEAIEPYAGGYDTEDGKVGQITYLGQEFATIKGELNQDRFISNLVKIQPPPQKDSDDTIIHVFTSYTNKEEKKMDIQGKSCPDAKIFGVHETVLGGEYGYVHEGHVTSTFYPATKWEPVEEWVKIEVRKSQWETINTQLGNFEAWGFDQNYHTVSWRPVK